MATKTKKTAKTTTWLEFQEEVQASYEADGFAEDKAAAIARELTLYRVCMMEAEEILQLSTPKKVVDPNAQVELAKAIRLSMARGS